MEPFVNCAPFHWWSWAGPHTYWNNLYFYCYRNAVSHVVERCTGRKHVRRHFDVYFVLNKWLHIMFSKYKYVLRIHSSWNNYTFTLRLVCSQMTLSSICFIPKELMQDNHQRVSFGVADALDRTNRHQTGNFCVALLSFGLIWPQVKQFEFSLYWGGEKLCFWTQESGEFIKLTHCDWSMILEIRGFVHVVLTSLDSVDLVCACF